MFFVLKVLFKILFLVVKYLNLIKVFVRYWMQKFKRGFFIKSLLLLENVFKTFCFLVTINVKHSINDIFN